MCPGAFAIRLGAMRKTMRGVDKMTIFLPFFCVSPCPLFSVFIDLIPLSLRFWWMQDGKWKSKAMRISLDISKSVV